MTIPLQNRSALIGHFRQVLISAQEQRRDRDNLMPAEDSPYPEPAWVRYERDQMHEAVNAELARRGLPPAPRDIILWIERQAAGHSDYVAQWAIRCADLVASSSTEKEKTDG